MSLLTVDRVVAGYGDLDILRGVSLRVEHAEIVTIIGPNGAGKSTLMKTIFGLLRPRDGTIAYDGTPIAGLRPRDLLRRGLVYVPQARSIFPHLTVRENLAMGAFLVPDPRGLDDRISGILQLFPALGSRESQKAGNLSGGEQRMLELGRAMLLDPRLVILDEPTIGLAPKIAQAVLEVVMRLHGTGCAVLIVEQNARAALARSHRGYVMELGRVRLEGAGPALLENPEVRRLYLGG